MNRRGRQHRGAVGEIQVCEPDWGMELTYPRHTRCWVGHPARPLSLIIQIGG